MAATAPLLRTESDDAHIAPPRRHGNAFVRAIVKVTRFRSGRWMFLLYLYHLAFTTPPLLYPVLTQTGWGVWDFLRILAVFLPLSHPKAMMLGVFAFVSGVVVPISWVQTLLVILGRPFEVPFVLLSLAREGLPTIWSSWQTWREAIVGLCLIATVVQCGFGLYPYRAQLCANTWIGHVVRALVILLTLGRCAAIFVITSDPALEFYNLLACPWRSLLKLPLPGEQAEPELRTDPIVRDVVLLLAETYVFLRYASRRCLRVELGYLLRNRTDALLQWVEEHPLRAQLESDFGRTAATAPVSDLEQGRRVDDREALPANSDLSQRHDNLVTAWQLAEGVEKTAHGLAGILQRSRDPYGARLVVHRARVWRKSRSYLLDIDARSLYKMTVTFKGEVGVDMGGVARDWFDSVAAYLATQATSPLMVVADGTLMPRPAASPGVDDKERMKDLLAVGRFLGLAVLRKIPVPLSLSRAACKMLLRLPIGEDDLRHFDPQFYAQRVATVLRPAKLRPPAVGDEVLVQREGLPIFRGTLLRDDGEGDPAMRYKVMFPAGTADWLAQHEVLSTSPSWEPSGLAELVDALGTPLTFVAAATEARPLPEELKPGGSELEVTDENKWEYAQLLCEHYLVGGVRNEMQCVLQGFWDMLPVWLLRERSIGPRELSLLISGSPDLDPARWRASSVTKDTDGADTPEENEIETIVLSWFWEVVQDMAPVDRAKLLHFVTGSSRLPSGGFAELRPKFEVLVNASLDGHHLPQSHTCFNQLILCGYTSKEELQRKLLLAMEVGEQFGTA